MLRIDEMSESLDVFDKDDFEALNELNFEGTLETSTVFVPTDVVNLSRIPDDYDYDMEASHSTFFWDELLPTLIVYCLTFVLGLVGNVLIIFTIFRYRKMKSTTNVFLASLASSDLLLILFCIPVKGSSTIIPSTKSDSKKKEKPGNIRQLSYSTIREIKAVLDAILIKEAEKEKKKEEGEEEVEVEGVEEEEKIFFEENFQENLNFQSITNSTVPKGFSALKTVDRFTEPSSKRLGDMKIKLLSNNGTAELEYITGKLSEEIHKYSNYVNYFNSSSNEKLLAPSSVRLSASDSKIELNNNEDSEDSIASSMRERPTEAKTIYSAFVYPNSPQPLINAKKMEPYIKNQKEPKQKENDVVKQIFNKELERSNDLNPSQQFQKNNQNYYGATGMKENFLNKNEILFPARVHPSRVFGCSKKQFLASDCCDDCKSLKIRIMKLEHDLEQVQRKLPFYPEEHQDSIKNCLESFNLTSISFLKKLKSFTKMKYAEAPRRKPCCNSKRSTSTPGPIVHDCDKKKISFPHKSSDCHVNIAFGITMENVDPVTGRRLHPDVNWENKQEGNIQCAMFDSKNPNKKPVMVLDTNFSYNPATGLLFSKKPCPDIFKINKKNKSIKTASCLNLKSNENFRKPADTYDCFFMPECARPQPLDQGRDNCPPEVENTTPVEIISSIKNLQTSPSRESDNSGRIKCTETKMDVVKHKESLESCSNSESESGDLEESKKNHKVSFEKNQNNKANTSVSRIPIRRKTTASFTNSKVDFASQRSSSASFLIGSMIAIDNTTEKSKLAKLFSFTWTFGFFLCKLVHYMQSVSAICSVLTLTAMSLERYYAIVHPMKAQYICTISQARRIITATWISAFLLAVPILFAQVHLRVGVKVEAYWCVRDWDNKTIWRAHELYMMLLILVVPTGVMAVAYTAICCEIWEVIQRRQDMTSGKGHGLCRKPRLARNSSANSFPSYGNNAMRLDNKRRGRGLLKREPADDGASVKQVIKMLVAVVVIYVICWGPMLIDNVLQAYGILSHIRIGWLKYMGTTFHLMAYFNSCINPIIYGFMSKNFRESFRKTLCCVRKKPKASYRSFSLSQTRNTSIRYAESSFGRTISIALPV